MLLQHIDVLFYYLRKKKKVFADSCLEFTTTDNQFNQRIQSLYIRFLGKNNDISVVNVDHCVAEYILGFYMMSNTPWYEVDKVYFPIHVGREKHWILGCLRFKERVIYVYNSKRSTRSNLFVMECLEAYSVLLPLFLDLIGFWEKYELRGFTAFFDSKKKLTDPFDVL